MIYSAYLWRNMKKHLALLWLVAMAAACDNNKPVVQTATDSAPAVAPPAAVAGNIALDTFMLGDKTCLVYKTTESPFEERSSDGVDEVKVEEAVLTKDTLVRRAGDTLFLSMEKGEPVAMVNNNSDGDDYVQYRYQKFIPEINSYCIYGGYYEALDYILLNRATGENVHIWGEPVLSPDKKHVVCTSFDLEAGFIPNGFQLFEYNNGKLENKGDVTLEKWGSNNVKWLDDKTLLAEYTKPYTVVEGDGMIKVPIKIVMQ